MLAVAIEVFMDSESNSQVEITLHELDVVVGTLCLGCVKFVISVIPASRENKQRENTENADLKVHVLCSHGLKEI